MKKNSLATAALVMSITVVSCSPQPPEGEARAELVTLLRDSLGRASDPEVAFIVDGVSRDTHLYVHFDTVAFSGDTDSSFAAHSRDIAGLSIRHYQKANHLDSITVAAREDLKPGLSRIHHTRTFSIAELK